jgi:Flp pilus assembly pilin Flp
MQAFWRSDRGTDVVEYTLILAFVALAGAATFIGMGSTTKSLWSTVNNRLASANSANQGS